MVFTTQLIETERIWANIRPRVLGSEPVDGVLVVLSSYKINIAMLFIVH